METLPIATTRQSADAVSATDASHSGIGRSTAVDYNLANIHKNGTMLFSQIVAIEASWQRPISLQPADLTAQAVD